MGRLLDGSDESASRAHDHLLGSYDARALLFEEMTVDGDASPSLDLTVGQDAAFADDELGPLAERNRALLEQAFDLDERARVELERGVAQHVPLAEVAPVGDPFRRFDRTLLAEDGDDLVGRHAARAIAFGARIQPVGADVG